MNDEYKYRIDQQRELIAKLERENEFLTNIRENIRIAKKNNKHEVVLNEILGFWQHDIDLVKNNFEIFGYNIDFKQINGAMVYTISWMPSYYFWFKLMLFSFVIFIIAFYTIFLIR